LKTAMLLSFVNVSLTKITSIVVGKTLAVFNFRIPQGSAATLLRCGRSLYRRYMESFLVNLPVNESLKVVTKSCVSCFLLGRCIVCARERVEPGRHRRLIPALSCVADRHLSQAAATATMRHKLRRRLNAYSQHKN